ncbi:MAG: OB-fold domain-containing protein [Deltaproteobacteria bacterium]|nr:OB-fold domain-containing protein [Deltaproteobacteria bacterium]
MQRAFLPAPPGLSRLLCEGRVAGARRMEWVDLSGRGSLHAFSQNYQALFCPKPDLIGLVDLEEGCGRVLSRIDAPYDDLRIGQPLRMDFLELPGGLFLHQFLPDAPTTRGPVLRRSP